MASEYYKPQIYRTDKSPETFVIPCPVTEVRIAWTANLKEHTVPLLKQSISYGLTIPGRVITVSGISDINANTGTHVVAQDEKTAYESLETLDNYLRQYNVSKTGGFEFSYFYKSTATTFYRKFKNCICIQFEYDVGDSARNEGWFPYTFTLVARDPDIYTTAFGS